MLATVKRDTASMVPTKKKKRTKYTLDPIDCLSDIIYDLEKKKINITSFPCRVIKVGNYTSRGKNCCVHFSPRGIMFQAYSIHTGLLVDNSVPIGRIIKMFKCIKEKPYFKVLAHSEASYLIGETLEFTSDEARKQSYVYDSTSSRDYEKFLLFKLYESEISQQKLNFLNEYYAEIEIEDLTEVKDKTIDPNKATAVYSEVRDLVELNNILSSENEGSHLSDNDMKIVHYGDELCEEEIKDTDELTPISLIPSSTASDSEVCSPHLSEIVTANKESISQNATLHSYPKDRQNDLQNVENIVVDISDSASLISSDATLFTYPREDEDGFCKIAIKVSDIRCLGVGVWLNDNIIDFWSLFLYLERLDAESRRKYHIFSAFFYPALVKSENKAQQSGTKDKSRVLQECMEPWTRNVNVFEKDFIFAPVAQGCHWVLAVICFPRLVCNKGYSKEYMKACPRGTEYSGDKYPCILLMDSMCDSLTGQYIAGILLKFLQQQWNVRYKDQISFNEDTIPVYSVPVPQQTNSSDCGLYILKFLELFLIDPLEIYKAPLQDKSNWFSNEEALTFRFDLYRKILKYMKAYCPRNIKYYPPPKIQELVTSSPTSNSLSN